MDLSDPVGMTALMFAARRGDLEIVEVRCLL